MKKTVFAAACAAALAIPASATAGETYIGVSGGLSLPGDSQNAGEIADDIGETDDFGAIPAGTELSWDTEFDNGYIVNGQIGYATDAGFRFELEGSYSKYDVNSHSNLAVGGAVLDSVDVAVLTRGPADADNPTVGALIGDGQGDVTTYALFANVAYDIETGSGFKPYVGAGLGYQFVDVDYSPSGVVVADDDDSGFAYQVFAGAAYEVSPATDVFAQVAYRSSFSDSDVPLTLLPATLGVETSQTMVTAGLRFRFGG